MSFRILLIILALAGTLTALECNVDASIYPSSAKVGGSFVICVHFKAQNGTMERAVIPIVVDKYTALSLSDAYARINPNASLNDSTIIIQAQNSNITREVVFYNINIKKVAKMMSFILYAERGSVNAIEDDNTPFCQGCTTICAKYTSGPGNTESYQNCYAEPSPVDKDNDPKIFISWMGTDSAGSYLLSQTYRISKFTEYGTNNVFESALGLFQKL